MSEVGKHPEAQPANNLKTATILSIAERVEGLVVKDVLEDRVRVFLRQRYPLTEAGISLREETKEALLRNDRQRLQELADQLPTVEKPNLHLFRDFDLTLQQKEEIFGTDLTNVQITKGCSHNCEFCAAGSAAKVKTMPFVAVLKIAEQMKAHEKKVDETWNSWVQTVRDKFGVDINQINDEYKKDNSRLSAGSFLQERYPKEFQILVREFRKHSVSLLSDEAPTDIRLVSKISLFKISHEPLSNYYDSDPFDYRDSTFPHRDGSPADYGDVFKTLASEIKAIYISTAGWTSRNTVAKKAVAKIAEACQQNPLLLEGFRISVNKYEARAKRSYEEYLEDTKQVIEAIANTGKGIRWPLIKCIVNPEDPQDQDFIKRVIIPLRAFIRVKGIEAGVFEEKPSFYSGPMAKENAQDHHDIMQCMSGFHIWPDGTVAKQAWRSHVFKDIKKGTRPQPIGIKLYSLS